MSTIRDVINLCGGTLEVAYRLNIHQITVMAWVTDRKPIPTKYLKTLSDLTGGVYSVEQIEDAHVCERRPDRRTKEYRQRSN